MKNFKNILYISEGSSRDDDGLAQALHLAHDNGARLSIIVPYKSLPGKLQEYQDRYEEAFRANVIAALDNIQKEHDWAADIDMAAIPVVLEPGRPVAVQIIRHILREDYDLLFKNAASMETDGGSGFSALDMDLLRKCPCPVWLCRPRHHQNKPRIAVAIDPQSEEKAGHDMSLRLLDLAPDMAARLDGTLSIVSCWDCEDETFLRNSVFSYTSAEDIDAIIADEKNNHLQALQTVIDEAGLSNEFYSLEHRRGAASKEIPAFVKEYGVDMLIMGTVARTGIAGFVMGNTAENILQKIDCSLLAIKPPGFISPVKP